MFSALSNGQNRRRGTRITSVSWNNASDTTQPYRGSARSVSVLSVVPAGATYTTETIPATSTGEVAYTIITGTGLYYESYASPTITIHPETLTGTITSVNTTYDGTQKTASITSISGTLGTDYDGITSKSLTNAGTDSAFVTGIGNYTGTLTATITIAARVVTLSASGSTAITYTGSPITVGYTIGNIVAGSPTGTSVSGAVQTAIGTYTAQLAASGNYSLGSPSSFSWSIVAITLTGTPNAVSTTYDGTQKTATITGINGTYTGTTSVSRTDVGTSSTTITGSVNYSGTVSTSVIIAARAVTLASSGSTSFTYTGSAQTVGYTIGNIVAGSPTGASVSGATQTAIGTYTASLSASGNYSLGSPSTFSWSIVAITLTGTLNSATYTYDGTAKTVTITGINGTYTGTASVSGTAAGTYTTTITGSGNYSGSLTATLTINRATLTGTLNNVNTTYDGTSKTATITGINGSAGGVDYTGGTGVSATNAGTTSTTITGIGNYTGTLTATVTIAARTVTLSSSGSTSFTYTGSSHTVGYTIGNIVAGSPTGASVSGITQTSAGSYTASLSASGNYTLGSPSSFSWTINPAALSASTTSVRKIYNGAIQSFAISGINGSYTGSVSVAGRNAGSYSTTITGTGNYTGSVTGTLTIDQDVGYVDIFYGGVYDASRTTSIYVPVRISNAAFTVTHAVSGPGSADAQVSSFGGGGPYSWNMLYDPVPPGAVVRNTNQYTQGFVVTITAAVDDPNYGFMSSTTSVTVSAYVPPSGGDGGFISE